MIGVSNCFTFVSTFDGFRFYLSGKKCRMWLRLLLMIERTTKSVLRSFGAWSGFMRCSFILACVIDCWNKLVSSGDCSHTRGRHMV